MKEIPEQIKEILKNLDIDLGMYNIGVETNEEKGVTLYILEDKNTKPLKNQDTIISISNTTKYIVYDVFKANTLMVLECKTGKQLYKNNNFRKT